MSTHSMSGPANGATGEIRPWRRLALVAASLGALALAGAPVAAGETAGRGAVVATVDGSPITEADLAVAERGLADALENHPPAERRAFLIDFLINQRLVAAAAERDKLHDSEEFARRIAMMREWILRDLYLDRRVRQAIGEDDLQRSYDEIARQIGSEIEVHARHILVETEEEARAIHAELKGGADFVELATQKSTGPSGPNGGDIGYFSENDVVAPFWATAVGLEPGQISEPVQTDFGWHVIKSEDKRPRQPPDFALVRDRIQQNLERSRYFELLEKLKQDAKIEVLAGEDGGNGDKE